MVLACLGYAGEFFGVEKLYLRCSYLFRARRRRSCGRSCRFIFAFMACRCAPSAVACLSCLIPWKVFWSPLVHRYGDRRVWIFACMIGIAGVLFALPFVNLASVGVLVLVLMLLNDDTLGDSGRCHRFVFRGPGQSRRGGRCQRCAGIRLSRRAGLRRRGIGFLAAVIEWNYLFALAGIIFVILGFAALQNSQLSLPEEAREHWLQGFVGWAGTWRVIPLILFVLTYKLGEFAIGPMVKPFWVDYGSNDLAGARRSDVPNRLFPTTFGIVLSVAGALLGGSFISRYGIFRGVWFLGLLQAVSNLGYSIVQWFDLGRFGLYGASMFESFSGGLGTAAFLAFLMNVCQKEHATVQYAFLSVWYFH